MGCKKNEKPGNPINDKVPETTNVIEKQTWESYFEGIDSSTYTLYFDKNLISEQQIEEGDIIVSTNGNGLLRKISKISEVDGKLKIETVSASLTEVVNEGETSFNSLLSTQKIDKINFLKRGIVLDTSSIRSEENTQLEYEIDIYLDPDEKIHLYGDFSILTELNGQLKIGYIPPRISLFEITYEINQSLNFSADIDLINLNYESEVDIASIKFQPIIAIISGVPVILVPELEISAGIETGIYCGVYTGINQAMDYTVGLRYSGHEWSTISEFNKSFTYIPPQLNCNAAAKAYIKPQFNIKIYNVLSPYLYGDLYGRIEADVQNNPWWNLYAGADLGVGIEAEILGKEIFDFSTNPPLISYEQLIASASSSLDPPIANFYSNTTTGTVPLTVIFTDQSTSNPTNWQWDFGDGNTSTFQNPNHTYYNSGAYTVKLTVSNEGGSDTEIKNNFIIVNESGTPPDANFEADITSGNTPLTVNFTDQSTNNPTTWQWNFGDGGTSTQPNPSHTYNNDGTYTVTLAVSNQYGADTKIKTAYITVNNNGGSEDLIAYYPFNGNANDESGNDLNGIVTNASLTNDRNNLSNRAYNFDGNEDFITIENNLLLQATNSKPFTWSFWLSPNSYNHVIMFKGKNGSGGAYFDWWIDYTNEAKIRFRYSTSSINAQSHYETIGPIPFNSWTFVTITYEFGNSNSMKIYTNGYLVSGNWVLGNGSHSPYTSNEKLYIGKHNRYSGNYGTYDFFDGDIDDIRIHNSILSASEVLDLFYQGKK